MFEQTSKCPPPQPCLLSLPLSKSQLRHIEVSVVRPLPIQYLLPRFKKKKKKGTPVSPVVRKVPGPCAQLPNSFGKKTFFFKRWRKLSCLIKARVFFCMIYNLLFHMGYGGPQIPNCGRKKKIGRRKRKSVNLLLVQKNCVFLAQTLLFNL